MVLAFELGDHPLDAWVKRALECSADHGGVAETGGADAHRDGAAGLWRTAFIRMPYAREFLAPAGIINDTFETSITWERFEAFHDAVKAATERAILEATGRQAKSPAASRMSIPTARRLTSRSMRSGVMAF